MNPVITPIFSAEPWLKSAWFAAMNASSPGRSLWIPKSIAGFEQEPKSRAARFVIIFLVVPMRALQAASCVSHWASPPARVPALAASAQRLCCTEQERWIAAPLFTSVVPSTAKGRAAPAVKITGGAGMPPRAPVKVWTLSPEAGAAEEPAAEATEEEEEEHTVATLEAAAAAVVAIAATLEMGITLDAAMVIITVTVTGAGQEVTAATEVATSATDEAAAVVSVVPADEAAATLEAATPATAELISAAVASSTRRFSVSMQPIGSSVVSQELPLAVGSPIWSSFLAEKCCGRLVRRTVPGANVPAFNASWGSPPMDAICWANARVMALFVSAAPVDAGSYQIISRA